MLSIPTQIKELYKRDDVAKNFRASFPNGERADITNADVVRESLKFRESVCSRNVFRFGVAESSVIQFETVGVENIYNTIIDCFIEIDTSRLTAEDLASIQDNPGDGVLVLESESDLAYGYYRIVLGRFRVASCPRNHGAMAHRKVVAYEQSAYWSTRLDPIEKARLEAKGGDLLQFNLWRYLLSKLSRDNAKVLTENNLQRTVFARYADGATWENPFVIPHDDSVINASPSDFSIRTTWVYFNLPDDALYGCENADAWDIRSSVASAIVDYAAEHGITIQPPTGSTVQEYVSAQVRKACSPGLNWTFLPSFIYPEVDAFLPDASGAFYTFGRKSGASNNMPVRLIIPRAISVFYDNTAFNTWTRSNQSIVIYRWDKINNSISDPLESINLSFSPTDTDDEEDGTFVGAYDPEELVNSALELSARFARPRRDANGIGGMKLLRLPYKVPIHSSGYSPMFPSNMIPETNGNTVEILAFASSVGIESSDYSDLWWDDYDVDPVGSVLFSYTTKSGQNREASYNVGEGASVYDMRDNVALQHIPSSTASSIRTLLSTCFEPHISATRFSQFDLSMPAWPWLEAGDALQMTAADGVTVVNSYALERSISGIQALSDAISATGGEVVEEEAE